MIDPAIGWIEIRTVPLARADLVANQVELAWLICYPLSSEAIVDKVYDFLAKFRDMIANDYRIMVRPITSKGLQANSILERMHQMVRNILRTFKAQDISG